MHKFYLLGVACLTANVSAQDTTPTPATAPPTTIPTTPTPTTPVCTSICPNNALPDPAFNDEVLFIQDGVNITCGIYQSIAALGRLSELECSSATYLGVNQCGCALTEDFCQLCEDGSVVPNISFESSPPFNCLDLAGFAFAESPGTGVCNASQAVDGVYCGCQNPVASENACRICNGTQLLPDPAKEISFSGSMVACSFLEYSANVGPPGQCPDFQALGSECCVGIVPPTPSPTLPPNDNPVCHVCGEEGVEPAFPKEVLNLPGIGSFNCSYLMELGIGGYITALNCRNVQLIANSPCGCGEETLEPSQSPSSSFQPTSEPPSFAPSIPVTSEPTPGASAIVTTIAPSMTVSSGGVSIAHHVGYLMFLVATSCLGMIV